MGWELAFKRLIVQCSSYILSKRLPSHDFEHINTIRCSKFFHSGVKETKCEDDSNLKFSGFIPMDRLDFTYSKSSGPGGQNVNKVNTKVEVRFHVSSATWISDDIKGKVIEQQRNRITKFGYLVITSDRTRSQLFNQADVIDKLRCMVFKAALPPKAPTDEEIRQKEMRIAAAKQYILREKRLHSIKKQLRGSPNIGSV